MTDYNAFWGAVGAAATPQSGDGTEVPGTTPAAGRAITGEVLIRSWEARSQHNVPDECPRCMGPTLTVGVTKLVWTYEVCACGIPEYEHLVETLWHRACVEPLACDEFRPFHVRGRRGSPAHNTPECNVCGRLEDAHRLQPGPAEGGAPKAPKEGAE